MHPTATAAATLALLAACVDADTPPTGTADEPIVNGAPATDWMVRRAVKPVPCTATLVGDRFVLTALHCVWGGADDHSAVRFYLDAEEADGPRIAVTRFHVPIGTDRDGEPEDKTDAWGRFADVALLELATAAPSTSRAATLAWRYPGVDVSGHQVGAGGHDGVSNPDGELRYQVDRTDSDDDDDGDFWTQHDQVNGNDSGGPFYVDTRVVGVVFGHDASNTRYTSVPVHLSWMLATMQWTWPGHTPENKVRSGALRESFFAAENACQYACTRSPCAAYNYSVSNHHCTLLSTVTGSSPSSWFRSALKD